MVFQQQNPLELEKNHLICLELKIPMLLQDLIDQ